MSPITSPIEPIASTASEVDSWIDPIWAAIS